MKNARGYLLLETVFAIFIIGLMLVLFAVAVQSAPQARLARDRDVALRIARAELEYLRAAGYAALPGSGSFSHPALSLLASSSAERLMTDYNDETKEVFVSVSFVDSQVGTTTSVSLTTLITEVGGL